MISHSNTIFLMPLSVINAQKFFYGSIFTIAISVFLIFSSQISATSLDFNIFRLGKAPQAVLIVGGIQGDEPGGFSAATLLATGYEILEGAIVVVPNLNFPSIIRRSRGLHGDMNRKFAYIDENDPEIATIQRIQALISSPDISLILNLHDGSGYYRPHYEDKLHNPLRWGQSIIIDQEKIENAYLGLLEEQAKMTAVKVNAKLIKQEHAIHIHNTNTAAGDHEMEKSLSYFAVRHNKPAFGLEASKEFSVPVRTYYHLLMIEEFLKMAGVGFQRNFQLTPAGVEEALGRNLGISFAANRIFLPLENARKTINYLPLPKNCLEEVITSKPIMAALPCPDNHDRICVHFGNRLIALIHPEWFDTDDSIDGLKINVDGKSRIASFGQIIEVEKEAMIEKTPGYRINVIGYDSGYKDESGLVLRKEKFVKKYSVDRNGNMFRVEVYNNKKFTGMFILRFADKKTTASKKNISDIKIP